MSFLSLRSRSRSVLLAFAVMAVGFLAAPASAQTTTFSGTVYSPNGPTTGDPIPNILVFVESPSATAPTFTQGIGDTSSTASCATQPSLTPNLTLGYATSKADGTFSFNVAGVLPDPVHLYIQAGKWRLLTSIPLANITVGGNNVFKLSMPAVAGTGTNTYGATTADLPYVAVVTGDADDVECIFPQIGISRNEVTDPSGPGHINLFVGGGTAGGERVSTSSPTELQLLNPSAANAIPLTNYDVVIFGCDGSATGDTTNAATYGPNLVPYTALGGRIFLTHYEWPWLASSFPSIATWYGGSSQTNLPTAVGQLDPSYSGEPTLYSWMDYIGALDKNTSATTPQFTLTIVRVDLKTLNSPAQSWVFLPPQTGVSGDPIAQFSFDTPIGAGGTPVVALNFSNSTATFLTGDPDDVVTIAVSNTSTTPTTPGLTLTLNIPSVLQVLSIADSSGGSWSCNFTSPTYTCTLPGALASGASDSVAVAFKIPQGTPLGLYSLTGVLTKGGLNQTSQCGRVLYNDYHVEGSIGTNTLFKNNTCALTGGKLSNAQKFLEYSLYNLSSFVAPANSDTIQIQQSSTISWIPPSPAYYGTTIAQIEDATVNTPGTTTYTITPNGTDLLDANSYTFKASFTPTDTTDYLSSSASQTAVILPDPTSDTINNLITPIYYGEEIGFENGVNATITEATQQNIPNLLTTPTLKGGTFTLMLDGTVACTGAGGTAALGGASAGACPDANLVGKIAGPHTLSLSYTGNTDFASSGPVTALVQINPDPTTTGLTTTGTGSGVLGTSVTFTAAVADNYATPAGTVTFYDSTTPVSAGSSPSTGWTTLSSATVANNSATLSLTSLALGTHNIVACFAAPLDSLGFPNMATSCSASMPQAVLPVPVYPEPTTTLLRSNVNPSVVGQAITFTSSVQTTGSFITIPTGTLTFYDGTAPIGTATLDSTGSGSLTTTALALGTHTITSTYAGPSTMVASTSTPVMQIVTDPLASAGTGFIMTVSPTTFSVGAGSGVSLSISILDLNNFSQPVQLSCTGAPAETQCIFDQPVVTGTGVTRLTITPASAHGCNSSSPYFVAGSSGTGLVWLGVTGLLLFLARKRRRLLQGIALAAALCLLPALQGCGGGNCTDFGVKPGTYTFTVTGTSTGSPVVVQTQQVTMTVTIN